MRDLSLGADRSLRYLLPFFLAFFFLLLIDPAVFRGEEGYPLDDPKGSMVRQLVLGPLYLIAFLQIANRRDVLGEIRAHHMPMVWLVSFALLSAIWSDVPGVTFRRAIHFFGLMLIFWSTLGASAPQERVTAFLRVLFPACLLVSLGFVLVDPEFAIHQGAWAGIFRHKSELAGAGLFATVFWLPSLGAPSYARRALAIAIILLAGFMLVAAEAKTELVGLLMTLYLWAFIKLPLPMPLKLSLTPIPLLLFAFWFSSLQGGGVDELLQGSIGRDTTLTERTPLWQMVIENIQLKPWLGEGYQGFWVGGNVRAEYILSVVQWGAFHSHNGYLEVVLSLGLIGGAIFLVVLHQAVASCWRYYAAEPETGIVFVLILHWLLISNLTQAGFCQGTSPNWIVFLLAYVMVVDGAAAVRTAAAAGALLEASGSPPSELLQPGGKSGAIFAARSSP